VEQELLAIPEHGSSTPVYSWVRIIHFVQLHFNTFYVPCCDVHNDFLVQTMFGSSLLPFVLFGDHVYKHVARELLKEQ